MTKQPDVSRHVEVFHKREECRATLLELRRTRAASTRQLSAIVAELDELARLEGRERARLLELTGEVVKLLHADSSGLVTERLDDYTRANRLMGAEVVAAVDAAAGGATVHPIARP